MKKQQRSDVSTDSREAFEAWARNRHFRMQRSVGGESYFHANTDAAWQAWQHQQAEIDLLYGRLKCSREQHAEKDAEIEGLYKRLSDQAKALAETEQMRVDGLAEIDRLTQDRDRLRECLDEAIDLVEDTVDGKYKPDSFTTQPWKQALQEKE